MTHSADSPRDLSDLTAVIKTFERPACLQRLIHSIRRYYPRLRIVVADDGLHPSPRDDVDYLRLPPDVGLSAGRNALLSQVRTPYFLLLDDDLRFTRHTRIEQLLAVARRAAGTIAGGTYVRCKRKFGLWTQRRPQPYHGVFERKGDQLALRRGWHGPCEDHYHCDVVHNFFVAGTDDVLRLGGWNPALKLHEHEEFFLRAAQVSLRVAYCPEVVAEHWNANSPRRYSKYRHRNFLPLALALHGVRTYITPDGRSIAIPPLESLHSKHSSSVDRTHEQPGVNDRAA